MRENRDFVVPVNIFTTFAHAPFSWAARHTTVCLDDGYTYLCNKMLWAFFQSGQDCIISYS